MPRQDMWENNYKKGPKVKNCFYLLLIITSISINSVYEKAKYIFLEIFNNHWNWKVMKFLENGTSMLRDMQLYWMKQEAGSTHQV